MSKVKTRLQTANEFFYTLTRAQLNFGAAGLIFVLMAAWTFLVPGPVAANPLFQRQTQLRCGDCHQLGRELDGPAGLNFFGRAFLQNGYKIDPAVPLQRTTQNASGYATFSQSPCGPSSLNLRLWIAGQQSSEASMFLDPGSLIHIFAPSGTLYNIACGQNAESPSKFVPLD